MDGFLGFLYGLLGVAWTDMIPRITDSSNVSPTGALRTCSTVRSLVVGSFFTVLVIGYLQRMVPITVWFVSNSLLC